ncbi:adenine phosphoribosyltransferase [Alkalibacter saccharofermentans]|uniref:Adenine phosphoribosyltransferase n=1 Tax=Alkalibacter saccharofermentans DSM 14828 TaxID=1120975 RepID=A0A1M4S4B9_9FIRM|nr:adenine phosphoribosyltransferase [Alkalibacter saccharofermentans]SHE27038.1 adenine phosphoribosyltransferase [Alkalibacter saccharofermentans DSM 14828]
MDLKEKIRAIPDFPEKGISYKDITTLLKDKEALKATIDMFTDLSKDLKVDLVVGPEARGFIFGTALAYNLHAGFIPIRKPGKLPHAKLTQDYELEYGKDSLEIHEDSIQPGQRVLIIDDLLATGGTLLSTANLIEQLEGEVVGIMTLIELTELKGRDKLDKYKVESLVSYPY